MSNLPTDDQLAGRLRAIAADHPYRDTAERCGQLAAAWDGPAAYDYPDAESWPTHRRQYANHLIRAASAEVTPLGSAPACPEARYAHEPMTSVSYTVIIEGCVPDTPITLADREESTRELVGQVVGWRSGRWVALAPAETVTGAPGAAGEIAAAALTNQTVTDPGDDGPIRVRVWEGADADTSTEPAAEVIAGDEPEPDEPEDWPATIRGLTAARQSAQREAERADAEWRGAIAEAMRVAGVSRQEIADAAEISPARAYQIRDGRR